MTELTYIKQNGRSCLTIKGGKVLAVIAPSIEKCMKAYRSLNK